MALITYNQLKEVLTDFKTKIKATFVEDITYNVITNKLSKTKNGNTEVVIDHVVENWGDLEHTKYAKIQNIFDKNTQVVNDKKYTFVSNGGGELHADNTCKIARIPCKAGDTFTVVKGATHDSQQMGVFSSNGHLQAMTVGAKKVNGKQVYKVTISSTLTNAHHFVFNMYNQYVNPDEVMVFEGHLTDDQIPIKYYPNLGNYTAVIDGNKVAITFDSNGTTLTSNTTVDAIKELDGKIVNAGGGTVKSVNNQNPDHNGNVTIGINNIPQLQDSLNNKVNTSLVGNLANQIPRIDSTGKLVTSIIPDLAITSVQVVNEKSDAQNLVTSNSIQVGDVVVIANDRNSVYMYNGTNQATFDANFIELSLGEGTIKVINNQRPDSTGSLTLNGTQINVNGQSNTTIQQEFDKCVKSVNGQTPTLNGEVTVNAAQINAFVGNQVKNVQQHMNEMYTNISDTRTIANDNRARINVLETKQPYYNVGDIVPTFKNSGNGYKVAGCTFMYCGTSQVLSRTDYPDFCDALGYNASTTRFDTPVIRDESILITNGKYATKRYYVCIKNR